LTGARLRKHADYQRAYAASRKRQSASMSWFLAPQQPLTRDADCAAGPRVGLTAGKVLGKAHERNRIKRRMREALRRHVDLLPQGCDLILHPRRIVLTSNLRNLRRRLCVSFNRQMPKRRARMQRRLQAGSQSSAPAAGKARAMTRILLATLAFYRRWLSPALHSLNPGGGCRYLPTCSEYAAVAIATHGPCAARRWRLEAAALPSLRPRRPRSRCPPEFRATRGKTISPRTVTIEEAAA
jgi:ribonuclease P protein component